MSVRSEREKSKMQEKYQMILAQMLKEDDNRFCADCDTKSPRWASWNLGIFICIRCAGFHRNLGVHISKVKSVNLDSWTAEQIASMQVMGNSRARAVYEANIPAGFRRPQTDSALDAFIRSKYEQRKWLAKEWIPPEITVPSDLIESETNQRRTEVAVDTDQVEKNANNNIPKLKPISKPVVSTNPVRQTGNERPTTIAQVSTASSSSSTTTSSSVPQQPVVQDAPDLLGLDEPVLPQSTPIITSVINATTTSPPSTVDPLHEVFSAQMPTINVKNTAPNQLTNDLESIFVPPNENTASANSSNIMSNDKILALFNTPQASTTAGVTSGLNIRPPAMQTLNVNPPSFVHHPAHQHLFGHQKSASFGGNLYQQATNVGVRPAIQTTGQPFPTRPSFTPMQHNNPNNMSSPSLQTPPSTFTPEQLSSQFSQFVPFGNSKTNTSASTLISGMPTRPVTEYMPASSDLLWQ